MRGTPMIRRHIATGIALLFASLVACGNKPGAAERRRGVTELQKEEEKAADRAANARAAGDENYAKARVDFEKSREDYRHSRRIDLADLDKKIIDREAAAKSAAGPTKVQLQHHLHAILAKRGNFARDLQQLDTVPESRWDATRARLDREWDDLKTAVDQASETPTDANLPLPGGFLTP
jgi:hypothetical protein